MRNLTLIVACLAGFVAAGCTGHGGSSSSGSSGSGGSSGSSGSSGDAGLPDAGPVDAGPAACTSDTACTAPQVCNVDTGFCGDPCTFDDLCPQDERCDTASGHCVAAKACDDTVIASPVDACNDSISDGGYCPDNGSRCRCETHDGGKGVGVCRRVRPSCSPCDGDAQCDPCPAGALDCDPTHFVFPAQCAPVSDAGTYCLRTAGSNPCPFGYVGDPATGACQPSTGSCENFAPCATDDDCALSVGAGHYCDTATGVCKQFCTFDYLQGTSTNCAPGQVCNVIPADVLPDAGLARYGVGTCGLPCDQPGGTDCAALSDPALGLTFACVAERSGEHRCRPVSQPDGGGCMDDVECAPNGDGGVAVGYCAIYSFACHYDCREGVNPLTSQPYSAHDCRPGAGSATSYKCQGGSCVEKNCVERGGASLNGTPDQLCCGEDRDHTGINPDSGFADTTHLANVCAPGVDAGQFYYAPNPPWCDTSCTTGNLQLPDGGFQINDFYTCSPEVGFPNLDPLGGPNMCTQFAQDQDGNPVNGCVIAAQYSSECPKSFHFQSLAAGCNADADCDAPLEDGGSAGLGQCVVYADGGGPHTCACTQDEIDIDGGYLVGGQCPSFARCEQHQRCIYTKGCLPTVTACNAAP